MHLAQKLIRWKSTADSEFSPEASRRRRQIYWAQLEHLFQISDVKIANLKKGLHDKVWKDVSFSWFQLLSALFLILLANKG